MKKILAIISMAATTTLLHAQGYIQFTGNSAAIQTNTSVSFYAGGNQTGGTHGNTFGTALTPGSGGMYDYALLYATSTNGVNGDESASGTDWNLALMETNGVVDGAVALIGTNGAGPGSLTGNAGSAGVQVNMVSGTSYYVMLVGWSSNLGSSWSQVESELASDSWLTHGYYGETLVDTTTPFATAGAGDPIIFPGMFPNGGLTLYAVPEPTTLALAGLGGMALLAFRRRNKKS